MKKEYIKLREMNSAEKRWYIWEYYKVHIGIFIALCIFIGTFIHALLNPRPEEYLYIAWDGVPAASWQLTQLSDALSAITPENETITVTNYTLGDNHATNNALITRFETLLMLGMMDIYITTREGAAITNVGEQKFTRPVDEIRNYMIEINPQIELHDRLYDAETPDYMSISLEGSPLLEQLGIDTSDIFLCVFVNTTRFYEIAKALEVLLSGT
ncbi:MAG: hypothetical protein FWE27_00720 [Defluviitaleaceae bacterium]|nr:hypothetical protein [Defluviitaleaceae bacterium]